MTTKHQLDALVPVPEQQAMWDRARAAHEVREATISQWHDPCGTRDRELGVMIRLARHRGLSAIEIGRVIDQTRKEEMDGT